MQKRASQLCVMSLNTWGDATGKILQDIRRMSREADVLCFQEVHNAPHSVPHYITPADPGKRIGPINAWLYNDICSMLHDTFTCYYAPQMRGYLHDSEPSAYPEIEYGNAMFVRKTCASGSYRDGFIYGHMGKVYDAESKTPSGKTGQVIELFDEIGKITVAHAHGAWYESDKGDLPWRPTQTEGILRLMSPHYDELHELAKYDSYHPRSILVGDFNVVTKTNVVRDLSKSKVFGRVGGVHLNKRCGVWRTRTDLYTGEIPEADHAFASYCLNATVEADYTVSSDHAALIVRTQNC